jgi:tetratricopeptide (TPR) repeat protein
LATTSNYNEELTLLRRAVSEPVRQLIVVEYDILACVNQVLQELSALNPQQAHVIQKFDFRTDTVAGVLNFAREQLNQAAGSRPAFLALVGPDQIEDAPEAPKSRQFWKEMNLARELLNAFDAQILICVERWSYRQALQHADHLLSWAALKIHLVGSLERPLTTDRTALSTGVFGDYKVSPEIAHERWYEMEQSWIKARDAGESGAGFLRQFFIPMLEEAISSGDLLLARRTRNMAQEQGQFSDEDMPRWHELNLILALAEHESELANEHAFKLLDLAEHGSNERIQERAMAAINKQAVLLTDTAYFAIAEPILQKSLELVEKRFGPDHPEVSIRLNNLASLFQYTNRLAEAELLVRRALAIDEKSFGADHPELASYLSNLALLLCETNRLAEAEPLLRRALAIDEKSLDPEHPKIAIRLNNLAMLLKDTNRMAEAEPLMRRALAINEKSFGADHPVLAIDLNNLALLLFVTNRLAEAEPLLRRALAINEKSLGPEHPKTAIRLNNLAWLLKETNRLAEAEPLIRRALAINEKNLGTHLRRSQQP